MKNLLESWDRFLNEENNAEKLDKSNEVREFINSLPDETGFSEIKSAIFDKFIDYPDVKDVVVYEAGQEYEGSKPSVVITFEEGKGIPPFDESLSVGFDFEESDDEEQLDEKKDDRCTRIAKRKYDVWPSAYASGAVVKCRQGKIWKGVKEDIEASELLENSEYENLLEEAKKKKAGTESSKEKSLRDWFGRKGAKGKSKGWVDCNAPDGKGGYKSCGRKEGEKRSKYPACRPTPGACKEKGKGKSWGKKAAKKENLDMNKDELFGILAEEVNRFILETDIMPYLEEAFLDDGTPACVACLAEQLDTATCGCPDLVYEAEYRGRKVTLNKPMRGDVKKFKVYVKDPKTGNIKKVNFGHGGSSAKSKGEKTMKIRKSNPKARKNFRARHNCDNPGPKTKARYWSCKKW